MTILFLLLFWAMVFIAHSTFYTPHHRRTRRLSTSLPRPLPPPLEPKGDPRDEKVEHLQSEVENLKQRLAVAEAALTRPYRR